MSGINWCDVTWNPMVGCDGCEVPHCWAKTFAWRLSHNPSLKPETGSAYTYAVTDQCACVQFVSSPGRPYVRPDCPICKGTGRGAPLRWTGEVGYLPDRLKLPKWRTPQRVAVGLMGDMFSEGVKFEWLCEIFSMIRRHPRHTFIILTKRPERMAEFMNLGDHGVDDWPPPNLLTGISAGDQAHLDQRMPWLLQIPGRHCISLEPLREEVNVSPWLFREVGAPPGYVSCEELYLGGPTGKGAWSIDPEWARKVFRQCRAAGVKFVMKKMGAGAPVPEDLRVNDLV